MATYIHNLTGADTYYLGTLVAASSSYLIPETILINYANNDSVLADVLAGAAGISFTNSSPVSGSEGINMLKGLVIQEVHVSGQPPFADKKTAEGLNLFNRTEGKSFTLSSGANTLEFAIPWNTSKFTGLEVINAELGDIVDLKILDDASGTYSGVPNYQLNQFGYTVNTAPNYYVRESKYDADLYLGMRIVLEFTSVSAKTLYVNYMIHEVK
jgi:hypothetical protein